MAYRTPDDGYDLFVWEQQERQNGEADDSVSERYASTAEDCARFAETDGYDAEEYDSNGYRPPLDARAGFPLRSEYGEILDHMTSDSFVGPVHPDDLALLRDKVIPF